MCVDWCVYVGGWYGYDGGGWVDYFVGCDYGDDCVDVVVFYVVDIVGWWLFVCLWDWCYCVG